MCDRNISCQMSECILLFIIILMLFQYPLATANMLVKLDDWFCLCFILLASLFNHSTLI